MNRLESRLESFCEVAFICIAIVFLPVWFPCLLAWVIINPSYWIAIFKSGFRRSGIASSRNLEGRTEAQCDCISETAKD